MAIDINAIALTIAGSDPSGGAGLQADLKTFQQLGVYGMSVVSLITVQNTQTVDRVEVFPVQWVREQLQSVMSDISPRAIKIGALGTAAMVRAVATELRGCSVPIVVDPVMVSKHGYSLVEDDVVEAYKEELIPLATVVTPNRFETQRLTNVSLDDPNSILLATDRLRALGAHTVLLKMGTVGNEQVHYLIEPNTEECISLPRVETKGTHGTGCVLAASITAYLARHPIQTNSENHFSVKHAIHFGIASVHEALRFSSSIGKGVHPIETRALKSFA